MNPGGDAADAMVRAEIEIAVEAAKLVGLGAKNLAALIVALLQENQNQGSALSGPHSISSLLKQGKPLTVFQIKTADLDRFRQEAKAFGVLYAPIKATDGDTGLCDIIAKTEDVSRINRIFERMGYTTPIQEESVPEKNSGSPALSVPELTGRGPGLSLPKGPSEPLKLAASEVIYGEPVAGQPLQPVPPDWAERRAQTPPQPQRAQARTDLKNLNTMLEHPHLLLCDPVKFKTYLELCGRFDGYSERNTDLIYEQRPDASLVLSRRKWTDSGYTVRPDAEPIYIYAPNMEDGGKTFCTVPVYDIADTDAGDLLITDITPTQLQTAVGELEASATVPVRYTADAPPDGAYDQEKKMILLPPDMDGTEKFHALAQHTAQARLHQHWGDRYQPVPILSDCAAVMICARYGVSTERYNLPTLDFSDRPEADQRRFCKTLLADVKACAGKRPTKAQLRAVPGKSTKNFDRGR